jgi:hypothetical protein
MYIFIRVYWIVTLFSLFWEYISRHMGSQYYLFVCVSLTITFLMLNKPLWNLVCISWHLSHLNDYFINPPQQPVCLSVSPLSLLGNDSMKALLRQQCTDNKMKHFGCDIFYAAHVVSVESRRSVLPRTSCVCSVRCYDIVTGLWRLGAPNNIFTCSVNIDGVWMVIRFIAHLQLEITSNVAQTTVTYTSLLGLLQHPLLVAWLQSSNMGYSSRPYDSRTAFPNLRLKTIL